MENNSKQVIVMRKDLGMRKGKMIAQGAHASMIFLLNRIKPLGQSMNGIACHSRTGFYTQAQQDWINNKITKVCVGVDSEEELIDIYNKAKEAKIEVHMITDAGLTEFHGIPTKTCLALGPHYPDKIDEITGHLSLL